jgi:hypothetical protein
LETGASQSARSDDQGEYQISGLMPGSYEVEIARPEYVSQTREAVEIAAGQPWTIDFVLEPQPSASGGGTRIGEAQLAGLPLNGRSYSQLATLQAGMASTSGEQSSRGVGGGSLTVAGGRSSSNSFLLDGTSIMDTDNQVPRSAAGVQLGSDAVYQVQVFSTNYGAEWGGGSGGTLNSITRSGTSDLHATVFEYFRNSKLDARNFFDRDPLNPTVRSSPPPFKRNQFGLTLTGPLLKERTFWMFGYEAMRDRLTTTDIGFLPDAAVRRGDFTDLQGIVVRHVDIHPKVEPYLSLYPLPNLGSVGGGIGRNVATVFLPTTENYFIARVDHKLGDRDSFFARYVFDDATSTGTQPLFLFRSMTDSRLQYLTAVESHIFSLTTVNAFRFGYTRPVQNVDAVSSVEFDPKLYFVPEAGRIGIINIPGLPSFGPGFMFPDERVLNTFQFADDVVMQRGPHTWKFGFDLRRNHWDPVNLASQAGEWTFNNLESFLLGGPDGTALRVTLPGSDNKKSYRYTMFGFYAQDSYQVSRRFQLNLGLRYELWTTPKDTNGKTVFVPDIVHDTEPQIGPMLDHNPSKLAFSPRVGFTWSPDGRNTTLSAGFGIYYDPLLPHVFRNKKNSYPYTTRVLRPPFDSTKTFPDAVAAALEVSTPAQLLLLDWHNFTNSAILRYNFSIQRLFAGGWRTQASYVGARGNHLFNEFEANQFPVPIRRADGSLFFPPDTGAVNPAFGSIFMTDSNQQSFYNALQISAGKTLGQGISVQGNYTYSKSVDDVSTPNSGNSGRQYPLMRTLDRGLSDFDIRHRLVLSYFYNLPTGRGRTWWKTGPLAAIFGNWVVAGITSFRSGTPFYPTVNVRDRRYLFTADRPNLVPGHDIAVTDGVSPGCAPFPGNQELGGPERYFDPCSFAVSELGTLGNVGRNTILGPGLFSMDASLQKDFLLGGERRLQFRTELFNVLNHTNFGEPSTTTTTVYSGASQRPNTNVGQITRTITTSRQIQFALRLSF